MEKSLIKALCLSFFWVLLAIVCALWISGHYFLILEDQKIRNGALSIFLFAWGTLGRLGFNERSWDGNTKIEKIDQVIFWIQYFLGTIFGVLSLT